MTGNCLRGSRPLLSFDKSFDANCENPKSHFLLLRELFTQIFSVPNRHPKSEPFFDRVYTFWLVFSSYFLFPFIVAVDIFLTIILDKPVFCKQITFILIKQCIISSRCINVIVGVEKK